MTAILKRDVYKRQGYGMSSAIKELKSGMAEDMIYGLISYVVAAVLFIVDYAKEKKVKYQAIRLG